MINDEQKLINIQAIGDVLTHVFKLNYYFSNKIVPFLAEYYTKNKRTALYSKLK